MEEQTIAFKTAKLAKEKGFNVPTRRLYNDGGHTCMNVIYPDLYKEDIPQPTQALLQKWLREKHQLYIEVQVQDYVETPKFYWNIFGPYKDNKMIRCIANGPREDYTSYEEALEAGLVEALNTLPDIKK